MEYLQCLFEFTDNNKPLFMARFPAKTIHTIRYSRKSEKPGNRWKNYTVWFAIDDKDRCIRCQAEYDGQSDGTKTDVRYEYDEYGRVSRSTLEATWYPYANPYEPLETSKRVYHYKGTGTESCRVKDTRECDDKQTKETILFYGRTDSSDSSSVTTRYDEVGNLIQLGTTHMEYDYIKIAADSFVPNNYTNPTPYSDWPITQGNADSVRRMYFPPTLSDEDTNRILGSAMMHKPDQGES